MLKDPQEVACGKEQSCIFTLYPSSSTFKGMSSTEHQFGICNPLSFFFSAKRKTEIKSLLIKGCFYIISSLKKAVSNCSQERFLNQIYKMRRIKSQGPMAFTQAF